MFAAVRLVRLLQNIGENASLLLKRNGGNAISLPRTDAYPKKCPKSLLRPPTKLTAEGEREGESCKQRPVSREQA